MSDRVPAEVFSPGEYLNDELGARGWSQSDFAEIIGRPAPVVNQIIKGKKALTPDIAKDFSAALGPGRASYGWFCRNISSKLQRQLPDETGIAAEKPRN